MNQIFLNENLKLRLLRAPTRPTSLHRCATFKNRETRGLNVSEHAYFLISTQWVFTLIIRVETVISDSSIYS